MPWNLLILPLLGGFLFVETFVVTRVGIRRNPPQRLLLYSAHAGVWLLVVSVLLDSLLRWTVPDVHEWTSDSIRSIISIPHIGKSFGALVLGLLLPRLLNGVYGRYPEWMSRQIARWRSSVPEEARYEASADLVTRRNDPFEQFLFDSVGLQYSMFTLSSGKVYVGILLSEPNTSHALDSISLAPWESGYRDDRQEYQTTTDYRELYPTIDIDAEVEVRVTQLSEKKEKVDREEIREKIEEEFDEEYRNRIESIPIVIPLREIVSARRFDPDIYREHFSERASSVEQ